MIFQIVQSIVKHGYSIPGVKKLSLLYLATASHRANYIVDILQHLLVLSKLHNLIQTLIYSRKIKIIHTIIINLLSFDNSKSSHKAEPYVCIRSMYQMFMKT